LEERFRTREALCQSGEAGFTAVQRRKLPGILGLTSHIIGRNAKIPALMDGTFRFPTMPGRIYQIQP